MIWCRFEHRGAVSFGLIEGDTVTAVEGSPFGAYRAGTISHRLSAVKLLVPVIPGTFYAAGANYRRHVESMVKKGAVPAGFWPAKPDIGYRANNALIAHDEAIVKPADAGEEFQYEAELVAVIGRTAKNVPREDAMDCILGWTIGNDVTERAWQRADRVSWRSKNTDTFKPMGPWIATGLDPKNMTTTVRINGEVRESFATGEMIFDAATYIAAMTRYVTLHPGDVIWLGTDGVPQNLVPGDTIEIEISGIGVLRNRIIAGD